MKINDIFRSGLLAGLATVFVGIESQALADEPVNFSFPVSFSDINPCTGELHDITIFLDFYEHQGHPNNFVGRIVRSGWTSDGYETFAGGEIFVANRGVVSGRFKDMWRNEEGQMFHASGRFLFNINQLEVKLDRFELRCVAGD